MPGSWLGLRMQKTKSTSIACAYTNADYHLEYLNPCFSPCLCWKTLHWGCCQRRAAEFSVSMWSLFIMNTLECLELWFGPWCLPLVIFTHNKTTEANQFNHFWLTRTFLGCSMYLQRLVQCTFSVTRTKFSYGSLRQAHRHLWRLRNLWRFPMIPLRLLTVRLQSLFRVATLGLHHHHQPLLHQPCQHGLQRMMNNLM